MWVYGSGFPKSHDISKGIDRAAGAERELGPKRVSADGTIAHDGAGKRHEGYERPWRADAEAVERNTRVSYPATDAARQWQGWGTALKPSWEPIIVARKPRGGLTYAQCATEHGSGALWIDGGRVGANGGTTKGNPPKGSSRGIYGNGINGACDILDIGLGRWPANLIHDGSDEATAGMPETGVSSGGNSNACKGLFRDKGEPDGIPCGYGDSGSASRYFYAAKASRSERDAGLEGWEAQRIEGMVSILDGGHHGQTGKPNKPIHSHNPHPCLKPLALTEYLAKLLRPPEAYLDDAALLVPFAGVGSEMIGAVKAGWRNVTGIELSAEYVELGRARLAHWQEQTSPQLELALP
jgi:site-specific DNA-methyltransferase (adenine-specific)